MTQENLNKYKAALEKEHKLVLAEINKNEKPTNFGDDIDHFEEDTDATEAFSNQLAVAQDLKARLDDIEVALEKIREGKYGICEKDGREIEAEILDVDPESRLCKRDKLAK